MEKEELYNRVIDYFKKNRPTAETELNYKSPYQLLVAVILSAQCTDVRVNKITPRFFQRYPDAETLAFADSDEVYSYIKSCSYPNNKSKHLIGMAKMLLTDFESIIPNDLERLQKLPGVGRKTANVILSVVHNKPALAVDTHVHRVAKRIGLTDNAKTPLDTEKQLVTYIPQELISTAHHWLILHGRYVCQSRKPKCDECEISDICNFYNNKE